MAERKLTDKETPLRLIRSLSHDIPGIYEQLSNLQQTWRNMPDYDPRCELPISAAYTYLVEVHKATDMDAAQLSPAITACYLWRQTPVIYDFDADLAAMLYEQADDMDEEQTLPWEVLLRLPYPCVYIKAPDMRQTIDGFFAWIEKDLNRETLELRIQTLDNGMDNTMPFSIHLLPGATLGDCLEDTKKTTRINFREYVDQSKVPPDVLEAVMKDMTQLILRPLQLTLYLCATNAEIETRQKPKIEIQGYEKQRKMKKESKASDVAAFDVGVRLGAAIRHATQPKAIYVKSPETPGTGSAKRPHSRRGHWHHYWAGPRDGERSLLLKWTAPTFIHADDAPKDVVLQVPVK